MNDIAPMLDKIMSAAQPNAVFSPPVESNGLTVITASEVVATGGFGSGTGQQGSGGGGGGFSLGRPVAAIIIGPEGVKVKPIVDATKLGIAGITAWGAIALAAMRMASKKR
jgi:uncharacterized spore protein YtfJ